MINAPFAALPRVVNGVIEQSNMSLSKQMMKLIRNVVDVLPTPTTSDALWRHPPPARKVWRLMSGDNVGTLPPVRFAATATAARTGAYGVAVSVVFVHVCRFCLATHHLHRAVRRTTFCLPLATPACLPATLLPAFS